MRRLKFLNLFLFESIFRVFRNKYGSLVGKRSLKQFEQFLTQQNELLLELSHSMQTPLTVLKAELENLYAGNLNQSKVENLNKIIDQISKNSYSLIHFSKIDAESSNNSNFSKINLSCLVIEVLEYVKILCAYEHICLRSYVEPDVYVQGNKCLLEEMFLNLLGNAVKYIGGNYKCIEVFLSSAGGVCLEVKDSGVGIAAVDQALVFKKFFRVKNTSTCVGGGMGLAISSKIAEKHSAKILLRSVLGKGSSFIVCWEERVKK